MQNILTYFNTFLRVLFGSSNSFRPPYLFGIVSPVDLQDWLTSTFESAIFDTHFDFGYFIAEFLSSPSYLFSLLVWSWFAWLSFHLLLIWPFKWIRSVVKR